MPQRKQTEAEPDSVAARRIAKSKKRVRESRILIEQANLTRLANIAAAEIKARQKVAKAKPPISNL